MVDDFDAGVLLIIEPATELIAENKDIDALTLEVPEVIELQVRSLALARYQEEDGGNKG